ncbi:MAG TPA: sialidase family protein [Clostridia bacterium]|nr:sialidase family protein [Clostridia bacterium]
MNTTCDTPCSMNRRQFVRAAGVLAAAAVIGSRTSAPAAPGLKLLETRVITREPHNYHGWPTVARRRNGQLLVVSSGGRESHVCPFGRVELMVSLDEGKSWGWPQVVLDSAMDDRDAGVLETAAGTLLVTSFTSLAYEPRLIKAQAAKPGDPGSFAPEHLQAWLAAHHRLTAEQRKASLGCWMIRSTDGGLTWSPRYSSIVNSPHGPVQLSDGRLLYAGVELWSASRKVGVCESRDDGQTWRWLSDIPTRPGDDYREYHELHAVETADGRVVVQIRNHNSKNRDETLQTESTDGGKTWSEPHGIGVWGLPSALLRLRNGNLLMTYGHRRAPLGNQARLSVDHGRTWSEPVIISGDGTSGDLGYPSTVELADGSLLTVWYESLKGTPRAVLRQAHWQWET